MQMRIFGGPDGAKNIIKHCIGPNKAKAATFASAAFGGAKKLALQRPKVRDQTKKAKASRLRVGMFPAPRETDNLLGRRCAPALSRSVAQGGGQGLAVRLRALWRETISFFSWPPDVKTAAEANEVYELSDEDINAGFDYILKNAPRSTDDLKQLAWQTKALRKGAPLHGWPVALVAKALSGLASEGAHAKKEFEWRITLTEEHFKPRVLNAVAEIMGPLGSLVLIGEPTLGKTPLGRSYLFALCRRNARVHGLGPAIAGARVTPEIALLGVGQFESMRRARWGATEWVKGEPRATGDQIYDPSAVKNGSWPSVKFDDFFNLVRPAFHEKGTRLHGLWKTGDLTAPPHIEELLQKGQTFVDNVFEARAKATAAPPRAQITAKRGEVESPETRRSRTLASFSGTLDIDSSPSPAKRQAAAASSSPAPAVPARGELEADLSQMLGADGVGPDMGEEADAANFLGATPFVSGRPQSKRRGARRAGKEAPRKRPAAAPAMRKPSAAPMQTPPAAPKKKASNVPYLPPAVLEDALACRVAVMSDADVDRALREAGCIPPKTDRACWKCGNDMVEQENGDFRCWVKSRRCTMSARAFTPLLNTSLTTADYYSCIWATGCGLDQAQTHRVTGVSRKKVELLMPRVAEAAAWESMQAADNFEHSTGDVEMGAFACSVRRAGSAAQNVRAGRGVMVVDRATGTRVVFPAKGAAVQKGAPPPPEGAEDVAPAMARIGRERGLLNTDGAQIYRKKAKAAGTLHTGTKHSAKQFAKTKTIGIKSLGAVLTKMAAKRHAQMRKNKRNFTAAKCAKGPMKSKKGPMKTAKSSEAAKRTNGPMKTAKSTRGWKTSYLLTRSLTNMAEANIGAAKGSMHKRSDLGKRNESMRTKSQLFYENTPGLTPILNAMGEIT
ncbi:unnamed protein product [Prorocentrum cordatum]|uniref:Uncharacterized protein n=1 Tax=Prorocentrum cordatum TaxID=2364126 RepID=A0ABN9XX44_9DINO|nr:unnamed protein product [Polarella glacialis]